MPASRVQTRRDLEEYLSQALIDEYFFREGGNIVRQVSTYLKSYLLEVHPRQADQVDVFAATNIGELHATREPSLWHVIDDRGVSHFVDFLDSRYPMVHTIALTEDSDAFVRKLTSRSQIDNCWFPSDWLKTSLEGQIFGFRLFFQHGLGGLEESSHAEALRRELGKDVPPAFRLQVSDYIGADEDLETLRDSTRFGSQSALDSLAWRFSDEDGRFIHDEVWHYGKVTANGTSWNRHLDSMLALKTAYSSLVHLLEENINLRTSTGRLEGAPFTIRFRQGRVVDVGDFATSLGDPRGPMRLFGLAEQLSDEVWYVEAVDLHTNDRISLDVRPDTIRAYIREGACGNVLTRLLVHLERHVGARTVTSISALTG